MILKSQSNASNLNDISTDTNPHRLNKYAQTKEAARAKGTKPCLGILKKLTNFRPFTGHINQSTVCRLSFRIRAYIFCALHWHSIRFDCFCHKAAHHTEIYAQQVAINFYPTNSNS